MATLERIRNRAGALVAVVIGLALFAFILGDFINSGGSLFNRAQMEIAEIGGTSVSYELFQAKVDENENLRKLLSQQVSLDEQTMVQIRESVWEDLVRSNVMDPEYRKLGLSIHPDELFDLVQGKNIHPIIQQQFGDPQTGQVNMQYLTSFLKNMDKDPRAKAYWLYIEQEITKDRLFTKYLTLVRKGLFVTSLQAKRALADRTTKVDFDYATVKYSSVGDSTINVTNSDLKDYYNSHKNDYKQQASRDVEYVIFPIHPSSDDVKAAEDWINKAKEDFVKSDDPKQYVTLNSDSPLDTKYYKENELPAEFGSWAFGAQIGDVKGPVSDGNAYKVARLVDVKMFPDSVKVRHILVGFRGQNEEAYKSAKEKADSILTVIKRGGKWNDLAKQFSDDPNSKEKGGDMGWYAGGIDQKFDESCFSGKKGDLKVIETRYGYHVLEILDKGKEFKKVQLAILDRNVVASSYTSQKVFSEASEFAGINKTYDKFVAAANSKNLTKRIANNLLQNDRNIAGLESPRELIRWAYKSKKGAVSTVFEFGDMYVVATLTAVREEGIAPLKQVASDVKVKVIREKKAQMLDQKVKEIMAKSSNITDIAQKLNVPVEHADKVSFSSYTLPSAGIEPAVIGTATSSPEGKIAGPVDGNNGVFVLAVTAVNKDEGDLNAEKFRLGNMYQSRAYYETYEALKGKANITDKRYNFY